MRTPSRAQELLHYIHGDSVIHQAGSRGLKGIAAALVQMAISRQREYLADATAVKLTRYPEGLASALEKLTKDPTPLRASNRATAHLYIVNPFPKMRKAASGAWSTHPPLEQRIQRIRQLG